MGVLEVCEVVMKHLSGVGGGWCGDELVRRWLVRGWLRRGDLRAEVLFGALSHEMEVFRSSWGCLIGTCFSPPHYREKTSC